ncbi:transposase [Glaciecola petra]
MSDHNVVARWHRISVGTQETAIFLETKSYPSDPLVKRRLKLKIEEYRSRLSDLSWFMKYLNEYIARRANKEDDCTGHFWEGRFKSYAILDDKALITCMAYVDLNPIRAHVAKSIDQSLHTSIYKRITSARKGWCLNSLVPFKNDKLNNSSLPAINMTLLDYLSLLKSTKEYLFEKHSVKSLIPELKKMSFNSESWLHTINDMEIMFPVAIGNVVSLEQYKKSTGRKRIKGAANMLRLYCDNNQPPTY